MTKIENFYNSWKSAIGTQNMKYLGNFNDNHDNARFLHNNNNDSGKKKFKAYTAFCLTSGTI
jgi:alpha-amylase